MYMYMEIHVHSTLAMAEVGKKVYVHVYEVGKKVHVHVYAVYMYIVH